jgi:hypothetical protein
MDLFVQVQKLDAQWHARAGIYHPRQHRHRPLCERSFPEASGLRGAARRISVGSTSGIGAEGARVMARCEVCGNDYEMSFEVHAAGAVHVFDSFECGIHRMAPRCEHCGCTVIGHGVQGFRPIGHG